MKNTLKFYLRMNTWLARLCQIVACCGVAFAIFALTVSAFERFFFGFGYAILNDLPPLLMPWVVFPMMGVLLRSNSHITVDMLPALLSDRWEQLLSIGIGAIILATSFWFFLGGMDALRFFMRLNQTTETGIRFPLWWIYTSFPVGFALLAWFAIERMILSALSLARGETVPSDTEGGLA